MAKDPAFLFYPGDWLGGTMTFTRHEKGAYMDLLMAQFGQVSLTIEEVQTVLGPDWPLWERKLKRKFEVEGKEPNLLYFNRKLRDEFIKRKGFCYSRNNNKDGKNQYKTGHMTAHMTGHMENDSENGNGDANTTDKSTFKQGEAFEQAWLKYPVKDGKKAAERSFKASVKTEADFERLMAAMGNYVKSERVLKGFMKNGSTWFANWRDWEMYVPSLVAQTKPPAEMVAATCRAAKMDKLATKAELLNKGYSEHRAEEAIMTAWGERR